MEELELTDPVVVPEKTTAKYHVISITLSLEYTSRPGGEPGLILIDLKDNNEEKFSYRYTGVEATSMIKFLNTANLTTKSMHKRILEKLSNDGVLPGTVVGQPELAGV